MDWAPFVAAIAVRYRRQIIPLVLIESKQLDQLLFRESGLVD